MNPSQMPTEIRTRNRILHILQLFERTEVVTVEAIAREMGTSTSSAYRDVQELVQSGFLAPVVGAGYVLGPAFVHFDRLIRTRDPLIRHAAPRMRAMLERTTQRAVAVLSRRYRDQVMCIHQETGSGPHPRTRYERGVAMPLFSGATSKVILAHLDERTLERIYLENEGRIRATGQCDGWKSFRDQLDGIRAAGVALTRSEVAENRVGIAAPIFANRRVIAGLSLIVHEPDDAGAPFRAAVMDTAADITEDLAGEQAWAVRR